MAPLHYEHDRCTTTESVTKRLQFARSQIQSQQQQQLFAELAVLRAQLDQLAPSLALATAASAETRMLSARFDVVQQQLHQQQQQQPTMSQQNVGGKAVMEQQVLQLQAQVRRWICKRWYTILHLPVYDGRVLPTWASPWKERLCGMIRPWHFRPAPVETVRWSVIEWQGLPSWGLLQC